MLVRWRYQDDPVGEQGCQAPAVFEAVEVPARAPPDWNDSGAMRAGLRRQNSAADITMPHQTDAGSSELCRKAHAALFPEVGRPHHGVMQQFIAAAFEHLLARLQDHCAARDLKGESRVLFHEQQAHALFGHL